MRILATLALVLLTTPAFAAATAWQEVAPGAKVRVISGDAITPDGKVRVGVEIDMADNLKTYWRIPGETGIPTTLDLSASLGVGSHKTFWPHPEIDNSTGYLDFVYRGPIVLPLELVATNEQMIVDLNLILGICSDICVPAQAAFQLPIDLGKPDVGQGLRIEQALATVPIPLEDDAAIGAVSLAPEGLSIAIVSADIDPASVIAASPDPAVLFGAPQKSPDSGIVILPLLGGDGQHLVGQSIEITFMTPAGPFLVEREIATAGSTPVAR